MNIFQNSYDTRLQSWYNLRTQVKELPLQEQCIEIDKWWQSAPLVTHHLHILDSDNWPNPWELLAENTYCEVARAVGICYTLLLLSIDDFQIVEASNELGDDVILVLVDNAKYILNYWPDTVLSNTLNNFKINRTLDVRNIKTKIG